MRRLLITVALTVVGLAGALELVWHWVWKGVEEAIVSRDW